MALTAVTDSTDPSSSERPSTGPTSAGWWRRALGTVRLRQLADALGHRLSFIPILYVVGALVLVTSVLWIDSEVTSADRLPTVLQTTVDSARSVFSAMAGGLITSITLLLSMMLITVQLASGQFSPRTLRDWLGNRTLQHAIGLVLGTTVFCLLALRSTRDVSEDDVGLVPHLTVLVAVVLGVASLIAVVRSVDHVTHSVQVESVADRVSSDTIDLVERAASQRDGPLLDVVPPSGAVTPSGEIDPPSAAEPLEAPRAGWVQQIDFDTIFDALPASTTAYITAPVGRYIVAGAPLVWLSPSPPDGHRCRTDLLEAFAIGESRTMQQDVEFGIVQLTDIAVRALSPGVNDPSTACEVIVHLGSVVLRIWEHPQAPTTVRRDGRVVVLAAPSHEALLRRGFVPILRYSDGDPQVIDQLRSTVGLLRAETARRGLPGPLDPLDDLLVELDASGS